MLLTLRQEDTMMHDLAYSVYGLGFAVFSVIKVQGLTSLHFGGASNAERVKQTRKTDKKTAHPIGDDDGATFEVADDFETKGLVHY